MLSSARGRQPCRQLLTQPPPRHLQIMAGRVLAGSPERLQAVARAKRSDHAPTLPTQDVPAQRIGEAASPSGPLREACSRRGEDEPMKRSAGRCERRSGEGAQGADLQAGAATRPDHRQRADPAAQGSAVRRNSPRTLFRTRPGIPSATAIPTPALSSSWSKNCAASRRSTPGPAARGNGRRPNGPANASRRA
jgi:hypothetical protein